MKYLYLLVFTIYLGLPAISQNVRAFGLSNSSDQYAAKTVYDNSGNMFVVGSFQGSNFDVDPSNGTFLLNSNGSNDFYIAKYSSSGTLIDAVSIGGTQTDESMAMAIDPSGNIYVTGWFRGTVDFDPAAGVASVVSNGHSGTDYGYNGEVFLAKYSNSLSYQWAFNIGGPFIDDAGLSVKAAADGGILLGGDFRGSNVDFDPSAGTALRSAQGVIESFVAKYNTNGQFGWVSTIGGASTVSGQVRDLDIDYDGNIYVLGHFDGSVDLDPGAATNVVNSAGCGDIYFVKLNALGQHQWGFKVGGSACDYPVAISVDPAGNSYITGYFSSSNVDFNPGPATNSFSSVNSNYDIFVGKYDLNGNYVFAQSLGGTGHDIGYDILATSGSYILAGYFEGTLDIDASASINNITSAGGQDGFIAGYYPNGQYNYGFRFGGTGNDATYNIAKRVANEFTIAGYYEGVNVDFDPGATQALLTSSGAKDAFFAIYSVVVLPLKLVDFAAVKEGKINRLDWNTKQEIDVAYFDIERSANGQEFASIGKTNSKEILGGSTYLFYDQQPLPGKNYYRLRIVDKDGKFEYSQIRLVDNSRSIALELYPVPVNDKLQVKVTSDKKGAGDLILIAVDGKTYMQKRLNFNEGVTFTSLDVAFLSSGTYVLSLKTENEQLTAKFTK